MSFTGFLPNLNGFRFDNEFNADDILRQVQTELALDFIGEPLFWFLREIIEGEWGMCGGMCLVAMDNFYQNRRIDQRETPPRFGDPLFTRLFERNMDSLDFPSFSVLFNLIEWCCRFATPPNDFVDELYPSVSTLTENVHWPVVRENLLNGRLISIVLLREQNVFNLAFGGAHQVLVYGFTENENEIVLSIYDPNNRVLRTEYNRTITFTLNQNNLNFRDSTGNPIVGFMVIPYDREPRSTFRDPDASNVPEDDVAAWIWTVFN